MSFGLSLNKSFQEECADTAGCNYLMFLEFTTEGNTTRNTTGGTTNCFLLRSCEADSTSACADQPDCQMAISGPVSPPLTESCCQEFQEVRCEAEHEVRHEFDVSGEWTCQQMCRHDLSCSFWTLLGDECFLYSACRTPEVWTLKVFSLETSFQIRIVSVVQFLLKWTSLPCFEHLHILPGATACLII